MIPEAPVDTSLAVGLLSTAVPVILQLPNRGRLRFVEFDKQYVSRLIAGDPATEEHFTAYFGELLRIKVRARLRGAAHAEDVCQETFLRTLRILRTEGIHHPERLGALVNSVANLVLLESSRAHWQREQPESAEQADTAASAEGSLLQREQCAQVRSALAMLPPKDQLLLRSVFLEERDKEEVCQQFGVGREYLRVLLHRAKQQFRRQFERTQGATR